MNRLVSVVFLVLFGFSATISPAQPNFFDESTTDVQINDQLNSNQPPAAENPFVINGTITGPTGGAENITVHLELRYTSQRYPSVFLDVQTDTQGFFEFDLAPYNAPEYALEFYTSSYRFQMNRHFKKLRRLELPYSFNLSLTPGVVVRGTVVDEEGNPIPDVIITGSNILPSKSTSTGAFEATGLSPNYHELNIFKEGYAELLHVVEKPEAGILEGVTIVLTAAGKLKGTVTDWLGQPAQNAQVVYQEANAFKETRTDAEGAYQFTGVSRSQPVELIVTSFEAPRKTISVPLEKEEFNIALEPASFLAGRVFLENNLPASSAQIIAYDSTTNQFLNRAEANSEGEFRLGPFTLGAPIRYEILPPKLNTNFAIADVEVRKDPDSGIITGNIVRFGNLFQSKMTITVDDESFLMERVDSGNGGLPGKILYKGKLTEGIKPLYSGELEIPALGQKGTFEFTQRSLMADGISGDWVLGEKFTAEQKCFSPLINEVVVPQLPGDIYVSEALIPGDTIAGQALDQQGIPIQEGIVILTNWNKNPNFREMAEIKLDGFFEFTCVPEGDFNIIAYSKDGTTSTKLFFARSGSQNVLLSAEKETPDFVLEYSLPE
ncbi:MAG: carboxypeptidase-like regulatory domain-containing protein [Sumerlaeia bacterium]